MRMIPFIAVLLLLGCKPYQKEYESVSNECANTLNITSTILEGERQNRERLFKVNPNIKRELDWEVRSVIRLESETYFDCERRFLHDRSERNFKELRAQLRRLQRLEQAARDIMNTNSNKI